MKKIMILFVAIILCQHLLISQCFPDRHSTNFFDGWVSCDPAPSPNPIRPVSHFIMYDFGKVYSFGQMKIWNSNDPSHLDWGMRDVAIDYSVDGEIWTAAGEFTFQQASGLSTYEGDPGPNLVGVEGRYLLITALNNYGGKCYGISEFRIEGEQVVISDVDHLAKLDCVNVSLYPNPFAEKMTMVLTPGCSGDIHYVLYDVLGHQLVSEKSSLISGQDKSIEIGRDLPAGTYMLNISFRGKSIQKSVVKMGKS